jgi:hypothetical protein
MGRMRSFLRLLAFAAVLLVLLAVGALYFLDRGAKAAVERGVTHALSVKTTVGSVSVRPFAGTLDIEGLRLANPEGFSSNAMLELGSAGMEVGLGSLMEDVVQVPKFELSGIHLRLEGQGAKTNYGTVLGRLKGGGETKPAPPEGGAKEGGKRFIVKELVIRDTTIVADYTLHESLGKTGSASGRIEVPEIRLQDVGNGKPLSVPELTLEIFRALLDAAASGKLPGISAELSQDLQKDLSELGDRARELGKEVEGALGGVKDIFKKD